MPLRFHHSNTQHTQHTHIHHTHTHLQYVVDVTDGSVFAGDVETFKIPTVDTLPATNVGATNSTNGGFGTLNGEWSGAIPGHTLQTFYRCGPCDAPYPTGSSVSPNTTVTNAPATGTMTPAPVTGLAAGDVCYQAVRTYAKKADGQI